jgi:hypothetical protein
MQPTGKVKTNKDDKPYDDIKIMNMTPMDEAPAG